MKPGVLIVDDSLTVRMDIGEALAAAGFEPLLCADLRSAREALTHDACGLIVLDVLLPDGDGLEFLKELRSSHTTDRIPVLLLSTEGEVKNRVRGMNVGADEYVGKPYDLGQVVARARALMRARPVGTPVPQRHVLVIDDSATFRNELKDALRGAGYAVHEAATGEDGLLAAAAVRPDVVVVDGMLPGIDGATVVRRLKSDAALRSTPCLLLTAAEGTDEELRSLEAGADAHARKSEDLGVILVRLAALLRGSIATGADPGPSLLGPKRLLAVDDSTTYLEELGSQLLQEGYDVVLAKSGEEALELLAAQAVDCILLDLIMPGLSGHETCRRIKQQAEWRDIPLVILTGRDDRDAMIESINAGADDYIAKSADFGVLKARLRAQLRRKHFEDENRRIREQLVRRETEARTNEELHALAEARAALAERFRLANVELENAYRELQATQASLVQSAKMASLGELVAGVAHEINNPLSFALSHLSTARRSLGVVREELVAPLSDAGRAHFARAESRLSEMGLGLERIADLVVKLRTFSRLDEGEQKTVSMRECIESVMTILGHRWRDRIRVELRLGEPDQLECYPAMLNQALLNLVSNALDALEDEGTLTITSGWRGDSFDISIMDSGSGIPEHLREKVFEPFFTTKPVGQGTGLGLPITYSIVKKHGGSLELLGREGGGTTALIRLPRMPGGT